jgi:predicted PurR-regulated permease PerM
MPLPVEPITLKVEQIAELNKKLSNMRHDVNNNLSMIMAAVEILRRHPESTQRILDKLADQPQKIAKSVLEFSVELEAQLQVTRS